MVFMRKNPVFVRSKASLPLRSKWVSRSYQDCEQSIQEGLALASDIMDKLEEAQIDWLAFLRHAPMRAQPRAQQRPEPFERVDMDFMEAIAIGIARIFALGVIDSFMAVTPLRQTIVDIILIGVDQTAELDRLCDDGLDGRLLNIGKHLDGDVPLALNHAEDGWLFLVQRAASPHTFQATATAFSALCPATT